MGWEIRPESFGRMLRLVHEYSGDLPIYVTENGLSSDDVLSDGVVDDAQRLAYLRAHLREVQSAMADGVDIRGYVIWSLLDNYEWALGYEKRFGLIYVDFNTLDRTPKQSYHALKMFLEGAEL